MLFRYPKDKQEMEQIWNTPGCLSPLRPAIFVCRDYTLQIVNITYTAKREFRTASESQ